MRSIPTELNTELLKEANYIAHLIELYFSTTIYYTDLDQDIFYGGNQYISRGLNFDNLNYSLTTQIDRISFEVDNVDLSFSSFVLNQELRGKICTIRLAALEVDAKKINVIGATQLFSGIIDGCTVDEQKASFDVYSPLILWRKKTPRRIHQGTCPWLFKGEDGLCGYSGDETWCDQTFGRCNHLNNKANFGGFRWLPGLQNKQIWWGKIPDYSPHTKPKLLPMPWW